MTMPSYKLTYFNMRGRAELPRYIFAYAGIAFEDRRVEWRDWPSIKKTFPLGKLPVLEVNGLPLTQSLAIARFLAKEAGLVGNSRLAEAQADALVDTLNDFTLLIPWREDNPQIKTQKIDLLFQSHAPKLLDHLQCHLGDREWLVGDSETWADLYCHVCFTTFSVLRPGFADHHPALCGLTDRVEAIPNIAKWIQSRPTTEF
ncbi:hematopoietic prostaglandin D synthase-like isoform X1 [Salvelinus namaycush]|uniref:glutathione transferase n=1 Tax=Salvelinus namaycush TaxID=8040 RepID=A0A8U0UA58_SALNM|nr:hematopoietic prostaglandin D synthase-like isoform X1 [Salvelinus namaycush]